MDLGGARRLPGPACGEHVIGPEPRLLVEAWLDTSLKKEESLRVQLSDAAPLSQLRVFLCDLWGVPSERAHLLENGRVLDDTKFLRQAATCLPSMSRLQRGGAFRVTLFCEQAPGPSRVAQCPEPLAQRPKRPLPIDYVQEQRMCGVCFAGPFVNDGCSNLVTHNKGGLNACPHCRTFYSNWKDLPLWDGGDRKRRRREGYMRGRRGEETAEEKANQVM